MKRLTTFVLAVLCILTTSDALANSIYEQFEVTTKSAEIYTSTKSSLMLESQSSTYMMKLEPNIEGAVMFSLGRHGYTSTIRVKNLAFGVRIEGYKSGRVITPLFHMDDEYQDVVIEGNFVKFQSIHLPIPVFFNTAVDSIKLHFSNSHSLKIPQYFAIDELVVVEDKKINSNPLLVDCDKHSIMIGVDGSSSIDKTERKTIAKQLLRFFKRPPEVLDSNAVCIMEFGKQVHSVSEALEKKAIVKNIKSYKKQKEGPKSKTGYTNWAAAFDRAIDRQPEVFIFITDRWSNYYNDKPVSFNAQYEVLIDKCNTLKSNGTRLLIITSGLNSDRELSRTLYSMLDNYSTNEIIGVDLTSDIDLKEVDLISMDGFETFERIDLTSLLRCGEEDEVIPDATVSAK